MDCITLQINKNTGNDAQLASSTSNISTAIPC